ncbi:pentapeptide repeat-containing protein [Kibdelosporangium philippinense]|uniref:Pentapeptide repeat-containing protein n=1 Tax=Kibdelosporangium philippinense TaxID=211113 RepID=A0ABS8ZQ76_9PSEU|nr:pentapeptide repeat-containing protein [Kibdelosporangium philippinense]MCE7009343.1 pentapeptide repeat-containing protein [Kibdelosporangium philippinense]
MLASALIIASVGWGATSWLLEQAELAKDPAASRVEAIKTGLSIAAATGGVFALLLAVRRQWHQEVSSADTTNDAIERRITELYTKAVEQVGSGKAAVRLAGLHGLERLGQGNESQREAVVSVLCAYLRMPYSEPGHLERDASREDRVWHEDQVHEKQVRSTAQRILARHLRTTSIDPKYGWGWQPVDLANAHLMEANFAGCYLRSANLAGADCSAANFTGATLTDAILRGGSFSDTNFEQANLAGADLTGANFRTANFRMSDLTEAKLNIAEFGDADFYFTGLKNSDLSGANFGRSHPKDPEDMGTKFVHAAFAGAWWSEYTRWPPDMAEHIATLKDLSVREADGRYRFRENVDDGPG